MREKVVTSALVSSCFSFTLFYFAPAQVCLTNLQEYSHGFLRLSLFFIGLSLFSTILLSALLLCVGPGIHEKLVSLIFATRILLPQKAMVGSAKLEFELPEWPSVAEKPEKSTGAENVALITITLERATATDQLTKEAD